MTQGNDWVLLSVEGFVIEPAFCGCPRALIVSWDGNPEGIGGVHPQDHEMRNANDCSFAAAKCQLSTD